MSYTIAFVDSITATPSTRLALDGGDWSVQADGTDFSPPQLRRAVVSTLLADGELIPAAAYGNRTITLRLFCNAGTDDGCAAAVQRLARELDRPKNVLMYQPATSQPVFFRTLRADYTAIDWDPVAKFATVHIPAEPFAYGPKETISPVTVFNDPAEGNILNTNAHFDTDVSDWTYTTGVTSLTRSTAVVYPGAKGSMLITPAGGVAAISANTVTHYPITANATVTARALVYMPTAWTDVRTAVDWYDGSGVFLSGSVASTATSVSVNTWTPVSSRFTAPAGAASAVLRVRVGNTPAPSNLCYVYLATLRQYDVDGDCGGCAFDISGVKGDVETPLILRMTKAGLSAGTTVFGVRRRGSVSALPLCRQAEVLSVAGYMTVVADSSASGGSLGRIDLSTFTGWADRTWGPMTSAAGSTDIRGTYRVLMRARKSVASDAISVRLNWGYNSTNLGVTNTAVSLTTGGTYWQVYDLGLMQAPYGSDPTTDGYSGVEVAVMPTTITIQATRTSGTGTFDIDYLLFVPADDELMMLTWPGDTGDLESFVFDGAHEVVYGMKTSVPPAQIVPTNAAQITGDFPAVSPNVTNRVAMSIITAGDGYLTAAVTLTPEYYPRYLYVRPVST